MRSHNNISPYTCKYCDRKFRHTSSLKVIFIVNLQKTSKLKLIRIQIKIFQTHERTHTSEKPYICGHCDYRCTNWPNLNKHSMRIHCELNFL